MVVKRGRSVIPIRFFAEARSAISSKRKKYVPPLFKFSALFAEATAGSLSRLVGKVTTSLPSSILRVTFL